MHKFAVCIYLLSVLDLFLCLLTIAISFCAFVVTQWFCPVCIKHNSCLWPGISLFWFQTFIQRITLDMFYILFIVVVVHSWNVNRLSISISTARFISALSRMVYERAFTCVFLCIHIYVYKITSVSSMLALKCLHGSGMPAGPFCYHFRFMYRFGWTGPSTTLLDFQGDI